MNVPKHWSLILTMIMPMLSTITTTPMTTTTTTIRLPVWSSLLIAYQRGDEVMYAGRKYRCVNSHRSYAGAEPGPLTWALWQKVS